MLFGEHATSQAESEYPELWNGLVGAWSPCLSSPGGTVLRDLSGRQKHGALTSMEPSTDWVSSGGKRALQFATDDYVSISGFGLLDEFTISGWCNITSSRVTLFSHSIVDANAKVHNFGTTGSRVPYFQLSLSNNTYFFTSGSPTALAAGTWYHLAMTRNNDVAKLYVNGIDVTPALTGASAVGLQANTNPASIGLVAPSIYSDAQVDDLLITSIAERPETMFRRFALGRGGWATPRRRRWNYATAQTAIPYWIFARQNARLIGGGVS